MAQPIVNACEINGVPVTAPVFVACACDPNRSVVVEACAGSGKTWLLVARMLRLLLAGAEPSELLAITFTRKAAQEMQARLMVLLRELALQPDSVVTELLRERGVAPHELESAMVRARGLLDRVLASAQPLSIDTFHSWFARLIQLAPLASGVPHGYALTEATGELASEAYLRFMQQVNQPEQGAVQAALQQLYELVGDHTARKLLEAFVDKRAEWWAACEQGDPLVWLQEQCGRDAVQDARLQLWDDADLLRRLYDFAALLGQGNKANQTRASALETALSNGASLENFALVLRQFWDDLGKPRGYDHRRGKLQQVLDALYGEAGAAVFEQTCAELGASVLQLQRRSAELGVVALNQALQSVAVAYLDVYQTLKAERCVLDFADLESQAYRLLIDPQQAAYLHSRLDSRYRHILLDEFQDTNPLQWAIVRSWLNAYGADGGRPSVFVVGDPKQSIYRFRRADPRVFEAARHLLAAQGAALLRTNQTRRNASAIVDVLNASFLPNPLFAAQTTLAPQSGVVWRLPLVQAQAALASAAAEASGDVDEFKLRDALTDAREEADDARRDDEGRAVASAILQARETLQSAGGAPLRWCEVMLLVKKRAHLRSYESALREAGIPFVSDKRGGLLESLEIADLIALLTFLMTPGDNRALAHVLKSPIIGAADEVLIQLAERPGATWWARLLSLAGEGVLPTPTQMLRDWLHLAPRLPVHDLLDLILHQGRLLERYVASVMPMARDQVGGNLEAFTALALNLDGGRYPSLPKFIAALRALQRNAQRDAPDEATIDAALDAVRILTIHSAKGLEADLVVLLDANHSEPAREDLGILCEWPQDADAPTHFSAFGRAAERGLARAALFAEEAVYRTQEDWNLLYVALTRAKRCLIVSGVADQRKAQTGGVIDGSWYHRLQQIATPDWSHAMADGAEREVVPFSWPVFDPVPMPPAPLPLTVVSTAQIEEGIALHALLERLTTDGLPPAMPNATMVARWLGCSVVRAATIVQQASTILTTPALQQFYVGPQLRWAKNEMELVHEGALLRADRVVQIDQVIWILDYKRALLDNERADYADQLARYRRAVIDLFPTNSVRAAVITADGALWEPSPP